MIRKPAHKQTLADYIQEVERHENIQKEKQLELDFDSDEPLPACPLRNNGDDICESCQ